MAGITNRGKYLLLGYAFRGTTLPTHYYVALCTSATAPTADTNTLSELTQIAATQGYTTNGIQLTPNGTDFDTYTEDDAGDKAVLKIKDLVWTASGGNMPASGNGARWAVLTDDNATPANRQVLAYWSLVSDRTISDTQTLTLADLEIDANEPA
jgi:hypothetical protein